MKVVIKMNRLQKKMSLAVFGLLFGFSFFTPTTYVEDHPDFYPTFNEPPLILTFEDYPNFIKRVI